ncbi:MAG: flagellar basal body P-ring formation chaperone FlgA [Desulfonauticus sp.]|nr:flagellar basal body P-ring formation chaperone FlgA [Desulfonauticus sp.]
MRQIVCTIFLILVVFGFTLPCKGESYFLVKKYACSPDGKFYFKDIVKYNPDLNDLWLLLKDKYIFSLSGSNVYIMNKQQLFQYLKEGIGKFVSFCLLPSSITLKKAYKVVGADELEKRVENLFLKRFLHSEDINFRDFRCSGGIYLDKGDRLKIDVVGKLEPGLNGLRFEVIDGFGRTKATYSGSIFVDVWKSVPVVAVPMQRGERLRPDKIGYKKKNLAYCSGKIWDGKDFNFRVKRSLGLGEIITLNKLERMPMVSRGEKVTILYQSQSVLLESEGIALEDGMLGQEIKVRNTGSGRIIFGRIIGEGKVEVF